MDVVSHTLVRNGMPFIEPVLRQVEPFMNRMLITVSEKSNDGTVSVLNRLQKEFPEKIRLDYENVENIGLLTQERQKQVEKSYEDWILFLDDDDWWSTESLTEIIKLLDYDTPAFGVSPFQVIDTKNYDSFWYGSKFFTKWFRNKNIRYKFNFPRDMIYSDKTPLYWRQNPNVKLLKGKYFHLSWIKNASFRKEDWASNFREKIKTPAEYPDEVKDIIWEIFDWKTRH